MTRAALAKDLGVSRSRLYQLAALGMPLDSLEGAHAWYRARRRALARRIDGTSREHDELQRARLAKRVAGTARVTQRLRVLQGQCVPTADHNAHLAAANAAASATLEGFVVPLSRRLAKLERPALAVAAKRAMLDVLEVLQRRVILAVGSAPESDAWRLLVTPARRGRPKTERVAKTRQLVAEARLTEVRNALADGRLLRIDAHAAVLAAFALALRHPIVAWFSGTLPSQAAGQSPAAVAKHLRREFGHILANAAPRAPEPTETA